jgi:phosphoribosylglycinamide formyltransferase-1
MDNIRSERDQAFEQISACLQAARPDLIVLCGFTFLLPKTLVGAFRDRIVNTHHASLPEHPGLFTKEQLVAKGEPELAATVHLVDEGMDTGRILSVARFPNFGAGDFGRVLRYYRFVQDVLVIQAVRDFAGISGAGRMVDFHDIRFFSSAEIRIIEEIKGDYDFE